MTINFASPATTDNYSTAFVPNIQANQTALAQWLDSTNVSIIGSTPTYAKRYNRTSNYIEEFSGSTWYTLTLNSTNSALLGGQPPSYYQAALGYTPYNSTNPSGYISGINSGNVTTALGYAPANPNSANSTISPPNGGLEVGRYIDFHASTGANDYDVRLDSGTTTVSGVGSNTLTISAASVVINAPLTAANYVGISSSNVTNALGYTPVQSGTGINQTSNSIKVGWSTVGKVKITVDTTDEGNVAMESWQGVCKTWCNFDGTTSPVTIKSSFNVASVTKNAVGDYTVNFTSAMTDVNYVPLFTVSGNGTNYLIAQKASGVPQTTTSVRVQVVQVNSGLTDTNEMSFVAFGN